MTIRVIIVDDQAMVRAGFAALLNAQSDIDVVGDAADGAQALEVTGRTHRDHQVSPWHIAYAQDTVEEQVSKVMVERIAAASDTVGGDTEGLTDVAQLLGADWLPQAAMTDGAG